MGIATIELNQAIFQKTERFFHKKSLLIENDFFYYTLVVRDGVDDGLILNARIELKDGKINIRTIWVMEYGRKEGIPSAKNPNGETGEYAKILCDKYFNSFFKHLDTIGTTNKVCQMPLSPDIIKKTEAEIDQCIDPDRITVTDINGYDRFEMTSSAEYALRLFYRESGEVDYFVTYNKNTQTFETYLNALGLNLKIPLVDVVNMKWETGGCFSESLILCFCDLFKKIVN